jgi:hypothetical protein
MKTIEHRSLGRIKIHIEFERFFEGQPAHKYIALAETNTVLREDSDSWRWNRSYKYTAKGSVVKQYYLLWCNTDDFANGGFTHMQTPSGRAMSFKSALKQFYELVKATEFVTFNKI